MRLLHCSLAYRIEKVHPNEFEMRLQLHAIRQPFGFRFVCTLLYLCVKLASYLDDFALFPQSAVPCHADAPTECRGSNFHLSKIRTIYDIRM